MTFRATLEGPDSRGTSDQAIWFSENPADRQLIARFGDPAPGLGGDVRFAFFPEPILASDGDVIFTAGLEGAGVGFQNNLAVYRWEEGTGLDLVFRHGDEIEVSPGSFKTISGSSFYGNNVYGRYRSETDDALAFLARFTDGSEAIVVVPEPSALILMAVGVVFGIVGMLRRHLHRVARQTCSTVPMGLEIVVGQQTQ
jgi:hypothetical protein